VSPLAVGCVMAAAVLQFESYRLHAFQRHASKLPWFALTDGCKVLGLESNSAVADAAARLDDDEKGMVTIHTPGGPQQIVAVSLSGLTRLAGTSRKPIAKRFNKWLHSDVVVSIFLTGEFKGDSAPLDALIGSFQPLLDLPEPAAKPADILPFPQPTNEQLEAPLDECEQERVRIKNNASINKARQGRLDLGPTPEEQALDDLAHPYYDWLKDPRIGELPSRTAADEDVLPRTKASAPLSPWIRDNPTFVEPRINKSFVDTIADSGYTPQGFGDGTMDKPTMFMRDELPLGHSADSWRVWVSEQWFRLPLELRQRWWHDTDYGKRAPSSEMIEAIIAVALP
jgi:hypothetical protein